MRIERGLYGVSLDRNDHADYLAWFVRNDVLRTESDSGYFGVMDKITIIRFKRYFRLPMATEISPDERRQFEEFAEFNLPLDKDEHGIYTNDLTFQAYQFFKLGKT